MQHIPIGKALVLAGVLGIIIACGDGKDVPPPPPGQKVAHNSITCGPDTLERIQSLLPDSIYAWPTLGIPEYQDEQRFLTGRHGTYGPVACVVASNDIATITETQFTTGRGALVGIIWVGSDKPMTATYQRLNLTTGYNCVYLHLLSATAGGSSSPNVELPAVVLNQNWEAFVVPIVEKKCDGLANAQPIDVIATGVPGNDAMTAPPVARFVVDQDWKAGVGFRCMVGWCTIGYRLNKMWKPPHGSGPAHRVVLGWFDDQELAVPATGGVLEPTARATVRPEAALDTMTLPSFQDQWKHVATVHHEGRPAAKYANLLTWGFTDAATQENKIYLMHTGTDPNTGWRVKIDANEKLPANMQVIRTDHSIYPNYHVVGTARWHWKDTDETIWVRCGEGCCLIDEM